MRDTVTGLRVKGGRVHTPAQEEPRAIPLWEMKQQFNAAKKAELEIIKQKVSTL